MIDDACLHIHRRPAHTHARALTLRHTIFLNSGYAMQDRRLSGEVEETIAPIFHLAQYLASDTHSNDEAEGFTLVDLCSGKGYLCMCVYLHPCMHECMHVCMHCVCVWACMHAYACIYA
jgi:hypothetical protein